MTFIADMSGMFFSFCEGNETQEMIALGSSIAECLEYILLLYG